MSLFISVVGDSVVIDGVEKDSRGFVASFQPLQAMDFARALLDASKAAASNINDGEDEIWGTVTNRFLNEDYAESVSAFVNVYTESDVDGDFRFSYF